MPERYSFSKLTAFHTCKHGYRLRYFDHLVGEGNAFSSFGSLVHSLMERYAKGDLELWDLAPAYEWEFDAAIPEPFPPNKYCDLKKTYYGQGLSFLQNFPGYPDYKILEVEQKFEIPIDDWLFNGVIDLVYEHNGELVVQDYKSKAKFKSAEEQREYARQLYLYSLYIKQKYGRFPDRLKFLMFRKNIPVNIKFDEAACAEAAQWAKDTVKEARECWDFSPTQDSFYCNFLCNHREYCEYRAENTDD